MINHLPVVSTTEGNFGIEAPENAIAIADNIEEFATKIKFLMNNEEQRLQIAENGFAYVNSNFSWSKSIDLLEQCYEA